MSDRKRKLSQVKNPSKRQPNECTAFSIEKILNKRETSSGGSEYLAKVKYIKDSSEFPYQWIPENEMVPYFQGKIDEFCKRRRPLKVLVKSESEKSSNVETVKQPEVKKEEGPQKEVNIQQNIKAEAFVKTQNNREEATCKTYSEYLRQLMNEADMREKLREKDSDESSSIPSLATSTASSETLREYYSQTNKF